MASELFIAGMILDFISKDTSWFRHNRRNIEHGAIQNPLWRRNALTIGTDWKHGLRGIVERVLEMGYQMNTWPEARGEFSLRGGTLLLFPVNEEKIWRIDFFGNTLETIEPLGASNAELYKEEKRKADRALFEYLRPGDYVVHQDHGIGIWRGIVNKDGNPDAKVGARYFLIEYRGPRGGPASPAGRQGGEADTLMVPVAEAKRINPYIGFRTPPVSRLGTPLWKQTVKKTKDDAIEFAKKLLALHASRTITTREPFKKFPELEEKLEASFPYSETESQKRALREIMKDLESRFPMDRILVGDVGFGKTELAMRASVRIAAAGKQVAILAPTTLLCDQHYHVWLRRMEGLPIRVARLSRLEAPTKIRETLAALKTGAIDIVIGTHRLLSKDVVWKNLGLLVVDEEQRFGVRAKETLKELKKDLDVLTLSATPLPRTLSMALAHLRNMSTLSEAPVGREVPQTFVLPFSKEIIKKAIETEISRDGKIYFLENRIHKIPHTLEFLASLVPGRRIGAIHGRMGEKQLIETMKKFRSGEIEILVSTTIIENGIDLADVNTLIIADASLYGLADLHQLRGRVGRGQESSFAYFFYNPERLTIKIEQRLDIIQDTQFLGSGSVIAEKDMEMRGTGNILGREQSGAANRVGLNLYSQFLAEAVEKLRTGK
jgi:transcription-repair coupling factor (superfamily II helicase)